MDCDVLLSRFLNTLINFNSRSHVDCDPAKRYYNVFGNKFQFTQSRGLRQEVRPWKRPKRKISIHAVTWTATCINGLGISLFFQFQFTQSRGLRLLFQSRLNSAQKISIHAVTWTATALNKRLAAIKKFQFTQSRGLRQSGMRFSVYWQKFQFTQSRGLRRQGVTPCISFSDFNSRSHVDCDVSKRPGINPPPNFNSRSHVDCDFAYCLPDTLKTYFNSRSHVDCD